MTSFTDAERAYLDQRRLARLPARLLPRQRVDRASKVGVGTRQLHRQPTRRDAHAAGTGQVIAAVWPVDPDAPVRELP